MVKLTVCTPTYNRGNLLERLFDSLSRQSQLPFEWVIIDDGSVDQTKEIVAGFVTRSPFPIVYQYQENSGKHIAMNQAAKIAGGDLFFVVDSDDYLVDNALELIGDEWLLVQNLPVEARSKIIGIGANRIFPTGVVVGNTPFYQKLDTDLLTYRYILNVKGDKAEAYVLDVVKNNPFPQIKGETFCPEALVFYRLAHEGFQLRFINESVYVCEYLEGGLTQNGLNTIKRGPKATILHMASIANYQEVPLKVRIKHAILFWRFSFLAGNCSFTDKVKMLQNKLFLLFYSVGMLFYIKDRVKK